jgi:diaminohydroxyphosphoribosylaminopyrimidine deaminase/5-amino-6-(5-phosphoribosylamino)uracil reductase
MEHALSLARKGVGLTSPNPMVGCVIVRDGEIVAEGFHQYEWRDHAEIVALKAAGDKARGATLYVNLEPCNHTGRTGPCSDAIVAAGVARVVAAMEDPNPATRGRGFDRLRDAGVEVVTGVQEDAAQRLNEAFAWWIRKAQPFVTLKSALTLDGQLALPGQKKGRRGAWITSEEARAEVQRMRHAADALLTGIGTILADDPLLTDRSGIVRRRRLLRVVLDTKLRLPAKSRIVKTADDDLLVITLAPLSSAKARTLQRAGLEVVRARRRRGRIDLGWVLEELGRREIVSALLEAGPGLNGAMLQAEIVRKLALFYAPKIAGRAMVPFARLPKAGEFRLRDVKMREIGADLLVEGYL